jgi:hypothetical protein
MFEKGFLLLLIVLLSVPVYGQLKDTIYVGPNDEKMNKRAYTSFENRNHYKLGFENDTLYIRKIFPRKSAAKLDSIKHQQLKQILLKITDSEYDETRTTMLHVYRKNNGKTEKDIKYKRYWDYIERHPKWLQSFLIGTKNSGLEGNAKKHVYIDSYDLLHNLFFRNSPFDINHLSINPKGEVRIFYGTDDILYILDASL